jgi:hypothetical protein
MIADVAARPSGFRFLIRALHTWPDEDLDRGRAVRDSILEVIEGHTIDEAAAAGVDLGLGARLIAVSTFTLTEAVVELLVEGAADEQLLARYLADALLACVHAAIAMVAP